MNLDLIEFKLSLNKYDSLMTEFDFKSKKLEYITSLFITELTKDTNFQHENTHKNSVDINSDSNNDSNDQDNNKTDDIIDDIIADGAKNDIPTDVKNIFRQIVLITHPDKNSMVDPLIDIKTKYYMDALKYYRNNNHIGIILIANKLGINCDNLYSYKYMIDLENSKIQKSLTDMEYMTCWVWYHTNNQPLKCILINSARNSINS